MAPETPEQIQEKVYQSLEGTQFAATSLKQLTGGVGNFLYHARLAVPLEDGTAEVAVKHSENYIASNPSAELSLERCRAEEGCLRALESFRVTGEEGPFRYVIRTPRLYQFDTKTNTHIIEFMPNGVDLKQYVRQNFPSPTPASLRPQIHPLGRELGRWITEFHQRTEKDARDALQKGEKSRLYAELEKCKTMQGLKHVINYDWLLQRVDQFPDILSEAKEVFQQVKAMALEELKGELMPIHGDYWTANIVLPNEPIKEGSEVPLFVLDWELAQLGVRQMDLGQMLAEMYQLWLYTKIDAGLWLVEGFVEGLGQQTQAFMFRVAIQIGCHLVCFGSVTPNWGTPEQAKEVARMGRDIIVNAMQGNREWFEKGELSCLFSQTR